MIAVFLVGTLAGYFSFQTYLRCRALRMTELMHARNLYCPLLLQRAILKFWIPLERIIDES